MADATTPATVYLVGAGPGAPGLATIRAVELIEQADVVVYDYLSNGALLAHARPDARLEYVGKKGFSHHVTQDQINALLVECAQADGVRSVVRLKGGDPFVFGRGGEEALVLRERGIPFEVVPGVTSAIAASAYAGIPVTQRKVASSVTLITGHEDPTRETSSIDWRALAALIAQGNTVCFYMGVRSLSKISEQLKGYGAGDHRRRAGRGLARRALLVRGTPAVRQAHRRHALAQPGKRARRAPGRARRRGARGPDDRVFGA
ncbi:MAG: uroporphyrinogen-III C-methyltransferase [Coriobacteriales bacterium]|nr:uroporphyrinogen-III C-methyltransferase [Coriobacteriales bacterium]